MSNETWWTSDTHFGHDKILQFQRDTRLGDNVEEMNEILIQTWNSQVRKGDRVYHLGDFSFMSKTKTLELIPRLNGQIHLILGNHDGMIDKNRELRDLFASVQVYKTITFDDKYIVMMHYPIEEWNRSHRGSIHLHGHTHGGNSHPLRTVQNRLDVGVDNRKECDMRLWHWDEIKKELGI